MITSDRLFIVQESFETTMDSRRHGIVNMGMEDRLKQLRRWAIQILDALKYLERASIAPLTLSLKNILLDEKDNIKLYNFGLGHMTNYGQNIDFPLRYPNYTPPEHILPIEHREPDIQATLWMLGLMFCEILHATSFWKSTDLGIIFDSISDIRQWSLDNPDANFWSHPEVTHLNIDADVLDFLHGTTAKIENKQEIDDETITMLRLISGLLSANPAVRPSLDEAISILQPSSSMNALNWQIGPIIRSAALELDENDTVNQTSPKDKSSTLADIPLSEVYHLWKLAGGDVEMEMKKLNLLMATPAIELLPQICRVKDSKEIGARNSDSGYLYSDATSVLCLDELRLRLDDKNRTDRDMFEWDTNYFTVVDENDVSFLPQSSLLARETGSIEDNDDEFVFVESSDFSPDALTRAIPPVASDQSVASASSGQQPASPTSTPSMRSNLSFNGSTQVPRLPLLQREKIPHYQYYRIKIFSELLAQYPASRKEIIHHAQVDIPPALRGQVWAAILGVESDYEDVYDRLDKVTDFGTDRQIEVDVPRCHQYNPMLASSTGHAKLRRLLKAWVADNKKLVYWQGLDSVCAPFLVLNFNQEALAYACVQKFIPKFLENFFLMDNAPVLQEYLAIFRHILSYHDPELSTHLDLIGFMPDLYAIPWFLTMFTHVFPLDKIYHLWDKLLVGSSSIPLFTGVAILRQIRGVLLTFEFNDCITLFSESFPEVDIEKCLQSALSMFKVTPESVLRRVYNPDRELDQEEAIMDMPSVEIRKAELAPRITLQDCLKTMSYGLGLDIRSNARFKAGHMPLSMNVQPQQLSTFAPILKKLNKKFHTIITDQQQEGAEARIHHEFKNHLCQYL
ncbi:hypothetical protein INT43_005923 [Umbelopsis isabellina]|uniref:Uncharacterized protein n=1 Tax=Mortierella isabellina TaxID=91625 RepID=A0A8H7U7V0_MORIS|nr:hypothetical protein INT43_005923 [Umbelopsis isabellina]